MKKIILLLGFIVSMGSSNLLYANQCQLYFEGCGSCVADGIWGTLRHNEDCSLSCDKTCGYDPAVSLIKEKSDQENILPKNEKKLVSVESLITKLQTLEESGTTLVDPQGLVHWGFFTPTPAGHVCFHAGSLCDVNNHDPLQCCSAVCWSNGPGEPHKCIGG